MRHLWLVSPYHTGSHRAWAQGYQRASRHRVTLVTMPGRFWKWRMQGGPLELAALAREELARHGPPDAILVTDMVNLPAWLGLLRGELAETIPIVLYMHENQLTYPLQPGQKPDYTYAMINWLSQVAATRIVFNSRFHLAAWFDALPRLLKHFPDFNHLALIEAARAKSVVLPVGIDFARITAAGASDTAMGSPAANHPPLLLWNQRWEYDKQPAAFFHLLDQLQAAGVDFQVAVAGENFRNVPEEFTEARARLGRRVVHWGFVPEHDAYLALLKRADLVVSTALHEFFGISVLEAMAAGAFPLLPDRLSYPELVPASLHPACLYTDHDALLAKAITRLQAPRPAPPSLRAHIRAHFDWATTAAQYDDLLAAP